MIYFQIFLFFLYIEFYELGFNWNRERGINSNNMTVLLSKFWICSIFIFLQERKCKTCSQMCLKSLLQIEKRLTNLHYGV
jgi:hypothetical protein